MLRFLRAIAGFEKAAFLTCSNNVSSARFYITSSRQSLLASHFVRGVDISAASAARKRRAPGRRTSIPRSRARARRDDVSLIAIPFRFVARVVRRAPRVRARSGGADHRIPSSVVARAGSGAPRRFCPRHRERFGLFASSRFEPSGAAREAAPEARRKTVTFMQQVVTN
jgi:hypothetical protein